MVWYSHFSQNIPQFIVIHTVKGFGIVNKAEIDVFLELSCFFDDPADVRNLISGSSAFSKTSLNSLHSITFWLIKMYFFTTFLCLFLFNHIFCGFGKSFGKYFWKMLYYLTLSVAQYGFLFHSRHPINTPLCKNHR